MNMLQMMWFFINPLNVLDKGWIAVLDIATFIILPWIALKKLWRAIVFYIGFIFSQITIYSNPTQEYMLEVIGVVIMLLACLGWRRKYRRDLKWERKRNQ